MYVKHQKQILYKNTTNCHSLIPKKTKMNLKKYEKKIKFNKNNNIHYHNSYTKNKTKNKIKKGNKTQNRITNRNKQSNKRKKQPKFMENNNQKRKLNQIFMQDIYPFCEGCYSTRSKYFCRKCPAYFCSNCEPVFHQKDLKEDHQQFLSVINFQKQKKKYQLSSKYKNYPQKINIQYEKKMKQGIKNKKIKDKKLNKRANDIIQMNKEINQKIQILYKYLEKQTQLLILQLEAFQKNSLLSLNTTKKIINEQFEKILNEQNDINRGYDKDKPKIQTNNKITKTARKQKSQLNNNVLSLTKNNGNKDINIYDIIKEITFFKTEKSKIKENYLTNKMKKQKLEKEKNQKKFNVTRSFEIRNSTDNKSYNLTDCFDHQLKNNRIKLFENGNSITTIKKWKRSGCICGKKIYSQGLHRISFRIVSFKNCEEDQNFIYLGVVNSDKRDKFINDGYWEQTYYFINKWNPFNNEKTEVECKQIEKLNSYICKKFPHIQKKYGRPLREGDTLTINLDMFQKEMSFSINQEDFRVAFSNIPDKVCFFVCLQGQRIKERKNQVTLL
ncbi:spry domain-containing socs box protein [Anaeramoeba flamelloides]|uniref:Spry domain-containing socs box protein n=1 Tax=Anaeramoeba flamelloides TaxID=1746091 RepID=A0AAV7ZTF7_9EUKA|nr:spry domain-containing socs box protein [Anaeramoeba flamelloides]